MLRELKLEPEVLAEALARLEAEDAALIVVDQAGREQDRAALERRLVQQRIAAELSQFALSGASFAALMQHASEAVCEGLGVEYGKVLELEQGGRALRLAAGVGWHEGLVGHICLSAGMESQAGYTLRQQGPVLVEDLQNEKRFYGPELLLEHGVVAGVSVLIGTPDEPWGVLGAHTRERRRFHAHDATFLQEVAGVLAQTVARRKVERQLQQTQRLEAVGRLAGGVAHDFNNLLTVILGVAEEISTLDGAEALADEIKQAGRRAVQLTRQLLVFSRHQKQTLGRVDLNRVVTDVAKMLRRVIGEDVTLELALDPECCPVEADVGQLEQVLMNLAVNARDAMPGGGRLIIQTSREQTRALLSVQDTGHGMDEEVRFQAFEPFFTTREVGKGTGLGLSIVYGIVKQSGGHVQIESAPGEGTTMRVSLPLAEQLAEAPEPEANRVSPGGSETVLLVEDEAMVRRLTKRMLLAQGYRVLDAARGAEALALLEEFDGGVDVVLSDMVMPEMSGPALAAKVAARWPAIPVLFMSGYARDLLDERGFSGAHHEVLAKPFSLEQLSHALRRALG
ncbi:MAG: response regulator [Deltaproteobacteria bacterium]|nr:response regulator [Deltaproteobacteria bacterium]